MPITIFNSSATAKAAIVFRHAMLYVMGCLLWCNTHAQQQAAMSIQQSAIAAIQQQVLDNAAWAMKQQPITVTATIAERSAGGKHDFYSEGDYWWPNPASVDSPYIQKDGLTNPDNFTAHREAMIRFSRVVGALASAYTITRNKKYVQHALLHCRAWLTDTATSMNPSLLYAQAIKGRATGRGIGIIDAIQLMEVAQGLLVMHGAIDGKLYQQFQNWFGGYLQWVTTHPYGKDEMNAKNNHGTCWTMQVAVFARFTNNKVLLAFCADRFKNKLLPEQLAVDGSFPLELKRTKPYGYSIFNLDAMATICQVLSSKGNDLWSYATPDGRCMQKAVGFLYPFIQNKKNWPYTKDVMYWNEWPVAQPFLLFAAANFNSTDYLETWKALEHYPTENEVIRNLPIRNPLLWL